MQYNRQSIRLQNYDYSAPGYYFITLNIQDRQELLGKIDQGAIVLSDLGKIVEQFQHIIPKSIGAIVRGFKIGVTKWSRQNNYIYKVWQRNFYEHIIRNEKSLERIRNYIRNNPVI